VVPDGLIRSSIVVGIGGSPGCKGETVFRDRVAVSRAAGSRPTL